MSCDANNQPQTTATAQKASAGTLVRMALPVPVHTLFDYRVPPDQGQPCVGGRIQVPFGPRKLIGICVAVDPPDPHAKPRPVTAVIDTQPLLGEPMQQIAQWLSEYYHHPLGEVYATLLPAAARQGKAAVAASEPAWHLAPAATDIAALRESLAKAPKQQALLEFLHAAAVPQTRPALAAAGFSSAIVKGLTDRGVSEKIEVVVDESNPALAGQELESPLALTAEQASALATIQSGTGYRCAVLDGVTGSGKTEVYLQLIAEVVARGQQALVLVPEIALTPQTMARFSRRFGQAAGLHSQLGERQRWQIWLGCRNGQIPVVIGTRSASLTPFANLGLIVVDEEHDGSFKQADGLRYSARDLAVKRAHDLDIPLVLGSATPALETLHNAQLGRYQHLQLTQRAGGASMPSYRLLDIRGQQSRDGISEPLKRVIRQHLEAGNQALLFINRRGFSPSLLCSACGVACNCEECDMPFTYHLETRARGGAAGAGRERLICHHCTRQQAAPESCPSCGLQALTPVGVGTQRTEQGLSEYFPDIPILRIDRDTVRSAAALETQLATIRSGAPALLVGTQMLAKGHHFPDVTLVAVLNADAGFASADFRAPERTAALIVQVAGRAGRAAKTGEVWVQTLQPEGQLLNALVEEGYAGFAQRELAQRQAAGLPPAAHMAMLRAESEDPSSAQSFLTHLSHRLQQQTQQAGLDGVMVMGPVPAPIARIGGRVRLQLMLLSDTRPPLHRLLKSLHSEAGNPKAPSNLRWSIDVDPYDAF